MLAGVSDEEFLEEMKDQHVTGIQRMKKKMNGIEKETGLYFLTFGTCDPPEFVTICYERLEVRKFTPSPYRCWNCLKFNHSKNSCSAEKRCANCGQNYHLTEEFEVCMNPINCVNCGGQHSSLDKKCPIYLMNKEINAIMVNSNLSRKEAIMIYKSRNPGIPYSRVVSSNSPTSSQPINQTCNCELQQEMLQNMMQQIQLLLQQQFNQQNTNETPENSTQEPLQQIQQLINQTAKNFEIPNNVQTQQAQQQQQQSQAQVEQQIQQQTIETQFNLPQLINNAKEMQMRLERRRGAQNSSPGTSSQKDSGYNLRSRSSSAEKSKKVKK
jgi:hypothetical protein